MTDRCKVCGSPELATYTTNGRTRTRSYCAPHWTEYLQQRRIDKRGDAPDLRETGSWQTVYRKRLHPPPGTRRVVIDTTRHRLTFYEGKRRRVWKYSNFKVMNTPERLIEFHLAIGYRLAERNGKHHRYVLERPAVRVFSDELADAWARIGKAS